MTGDAPRNLVGYGRNAPRVEWPGGARLALQIVLNYEEGAERCPLDGDDGAETFLADLAADPSTGGGRAPGERSRHRRHRDLTSESNFEYGSRVGFWRLHDLFVEREIPVTVFAVGMALERHPEAASAMVEAGFEVASHGWRWLDYARIPEAEERAHVKRSVETIRKLTGSRPLGWYTGRASAATRRLVVEEGGFLYDADAYNDDLPYWVDVGGRPHLVVPYSLDNNDMRYATTPGLATGDELFAYLRDAFDVLRAEGARAPKMMSVGIHCRLSGRPGRTAALRRFLDHVARCDDVWICRRLDIARFWARHHPAP